MPTRLTLLGTGSPTPLTYRAGSSYLLQLDDEVLLIDCGPGAGRRLLEAGTPPRDITTLFLTHLHYDHCVDYAYVLLNRWDQGVGRIPELQVYGPKGTQRMTDLLLGKEGVFGPDLAARTGHPGSHFVYEKRGGVLPRERPNPRVREVEDGSAAGGKGWTLRVAEVVHCPPLVTLAYRLDTDDCSIVFGADTASTPGLTQLADNVDVLLHMCHLINNMETDERITNCVSGHRDAATTARDANVKTLVLVHITEQLEKPGVRERVIREAGEIFGGNIIFGEDLLDVPIGPIQPEELR